MVERESSPYYKDQMQHRSIPVFYGCRLYIAVLKVIVCKSCSWLSLKAKYTKVTPKSYSTLSIKDHRNNKNIPYKTIKKNFLMAMFVAKLFFTYLNFNKNFKKRILKITIIIYNILKQILHSIQKQTTIVESWFKTKNKFSE